MGDGRATGRHNARAFAIELRSTRDMDVDEEKPGDASFDWRALECVFAREDEDDELIKHKAKANCEVFLGSIASDGDEHDVKVAMTTCGAHEQCEDVRLMRDHATGKHRGYAFATYANAEAAKKAIEAMVSKHCEVRGQKIRASLKPNKYRLRVGDLRRDATRAEVIEALRTCGAGLDRFSLASARRDGGKEGAHNGGYGFAVYVNEACAERAFKAIKQTKLEKVAQDVARGVSCEWSAARNEMDSRTLCVTKMNETNNTEEALKEAFERFGDIEEVRLRGKMAFVAFVKSESASKAIGECESTEDAAASAAAKNPGGDFISCVDGSMLHISFARTLSAEPERKPQRGGRGGAQRGRDDWSGARSSGSKYGGNSYGGGLAPRSWSGVGGRGAPSATPVILPTGQVAYVVGSTAGRGGGNDRRRGTGRRGGAGGNSRHRPY